MEKKRERETSKRIQISTSMKRQEKTDMQAKGRDEGNRKQSEGQ